ncbi:MAG: molybdenum cofactor guanylyltransferase, partial [Chloroflexaceae bacterium]|nr:molybdenum cofactor guanylyltransferase [Chloroflexaceae bacterium]
MRNSANCQPFDCAQGRLPTLRLRSGQAANPSTALRAGCQLTTGIVLAGGTSRRMGRDKRRLRPWGEGGPTLLEHCVHVVGQVCAEVLVVLNDAPAWPQLPARPVADVYPDGGALGGLYSGLAAATHDYALVVACDMPLLNPALLGAMLDLPRDYEALVPRSPRPGLARNRMDVEPLHAIYHKNCLPHLEANGEHGVLWRVLQRHVARHVHVGL